MFRWLAGLRVVLRSVLHRNRAEEELQEEFRFHLEQEINERVKAGVPPDEARYAAIRAMGPISRSQDESRDARGIRWLEDLFQDFLFGVRSIKRSKGLALGVLISMGLGLGATATIFSFVDSFLLRPLPVPDTSHVVRITNSTPAGSNGRFSYPEIQDYTERSQSFEGIVTFQPITAGLAAKPADEPRLTLATLVSGNFFSVLRVKPALGRGFLPEEDSVPGRDAVAIISHTTWQRDFGGTADIVGRTTTIDGHTFTIVGVAPPEFLEVELFAEPEIFIPRMMAQEPYMGLGATDLTNRSARYTGIFARLKPGVTSEKANAEMARIASQLELEHPETNKETKAVVMTQAEYANQGRKNGGPGVALFGIAFLVLGIACVNVSNLLLSAAPARTREMAVRVAMGAPRGRLVKQLLLESAILSSGGILAGLAVASWCAGFLSSIRVGSSLMPVHAQARIDEDVVFSRSPSDWFRHFCREPFRRGAAPGTI